ncbi:MAG: DUF3899 domain-containing protein [Lachnospiraceae bacterium]|nr:DUF3899 domain-containing protein [Lachnospiraceae bacterium]
MIRDRIKEIPIRSYVTTLIFAIAGAVIIADYRGAFVGQSQAATMSAVCDGCFTVGILLVCFGLLALTASGGAFDMLGFSMQLLLSLFSKEKRKDKDFYAYSERKKELRKEKAIPMNLFLVGLLFVLAAVVILVVFKLY